eukprot:33950-Pyramimonas_sp.AAC.1
MAKAARRGRGRRILVGTRRRQPARQREALGEARAVLFCSAGVKCASDASSTEPSFVARPSTYIDLRNVTRATSISTP